MEKTDEKKTAEAELISDATSYMLAVDPWYSDEEASFFDGVRFGFNYATTAQQSIIDGQKERIEAVQNALAKTIGILQNIRYETDYMPDSYYEWIDKVIRETEEYLPEYE